MREKRSPNPALRRRLVLLSAIVAGIGGGIPAGALDLGDAPSRTWSEIRGAGSAAAAGDVNGDGHGDIAVSRGDLVQPPSRGRTWVLFGPWTSGSVEDVRDWGGDGFVVSGALPGDFASNTKSAGDVNGDGLDDLVIGAPGASSDGREYSGAAYVVFGKADAADVDLGALEWGFRIDGPSGLARAGQSVSAAGDVNSDGLDDVLVAAPNAGSVYVVFGKSSTTAVDLRTFDANVQATAGYRIDYPVPDQSDGVAVAGGGDVNGDGTPDVLIGHVPETYDSAGSVYVVFGKSTPDPVDVSALGPRGFEIQGRRPGDSTGYSVADPGDVDGDGLADVLLGAPRVNYDAAGSAALVYGSRDTTTVRLADLGDRGILFAPGRDGDNAGNAVDGGGDVNGDGVPDLVIGARMARRDGREMSGSVYVVYGGGTANRLRLRALDGSRGYRIDGVRGAPGRCDRPDWSFCPGDLLGHTVGTMSDVDGDGKSDVVVGAYTAAKRRLGRSYLIRGR